MLKGWPSQGKHSKGFDNLSSLSITEEHTEAKPEFNTIQPLGSDKYGIDTAPKYAFEVTGTADTVEAWPTVVLTEQKKRIIKATAHGARVGDFLRWVTGNNQYVESPIISVPTANYIALGHSLPFTPSAGDTFMLMRYQTAMCTSGGSPIVTIDTLDIVDVLDTTLNDCSVKAIPASGGALTVFVASLALDVKKIQIIDDLGEFIGIYENAALRGVTPLGGGEMEIMLASGASIGLRNMKNVAINSGFISINFLG